MDEIANLKKDKQKIESDYKNLQSGENDIFHCQWVFNLFLLGVTIRAPIVFQFAFSICSSHNILN